MNEARERILSRLRANCPGAGAAPTAYTKTLGWDREQRIAHFSERMQAVRGEVHRVARNTWVDWINDTLPARGMRRALVGHSAMADRFADCASRSFQVTRYERPVEEWKHALFHHIDFALTGARAGLAESGSLVLWPNRAEPRLMSLVPPLHVALLEADRLFENFAELIAKEEWAAGLPTNALLVSGPSKTADIEQTLAYGVHGPKQLITLILE